MPRFRDAQGNIWEATGPDDPNPVFVSGPQQSSGPVALPADPMRAPQVQSAQAGANVATGTARTSIQTNEAPSGFMWIDPNNPEAGVKPIPGAPTANDRPALTSAQRGEAFKAFQDGVTLGKRIDEMKQAFATGPGSTTGVMGARDFLPIPSNRVFDAKANSIRALLRGAMEFTGKELDRPEEVKLNLGPYIPEASDFDEVIQEKFALLESVRDQTYDRAIRMLGGVPNRDGNVIPLPQGATADRETVERLAATRGSPEQAMQQLQQEPGSALDQLFLGRDNTEFAVAGRGDVGAGGSTTDPYPPAMIRAHDEMVSRLVQEGGGRIDPQAYAAERGALEQQFGFAGDPEANAQWATGVNEYLDAGGRTIPSGILEPERIMSATETMRNNLVNNPIGGAVVGGANALGFGALDAMAPDEMMAMRDAQFGPMLAGEIGGAIGGTAALGAAGRMAAGRVAPQLLQGGGRGQFARNLGTDATYGAAYGGVSQGDPLTGAALGAGGSALGQGVGRGLAAGVGGAQISDAAQALKQQGVPVSVARQLGAGRAEDAMQSIPIVGDMSRARQLDSFQGFNQAAMRQAGEPIGFNPTQAGAAGVEDMRQAVGDAYSTAVRDITAPLDRQFLKDLVPVRSMGRNMSPTNRAQLAETLQDAMQLPADAGAITGQQFQDAVSALKALRSNAKGVMPNSAQTLRKAATQTINALEGAMKRAGGDDVIEGLNAANAANRGFKTIENAALDAAKVGTQTGAPNIFTPAQLTGAARRAENKGFGQNPLMELARQGQQVLPSTLPNSGTTDRAIMAGLTGAAGLGAGGGALMGGSEGAQSGAVGGAGLAGALALLGTRQGQKALEQVLITRPQGMQRLGQGFRRRQGLFGTAAVPIALGAQ